MPQMIEYPGALAQILKDAYKNVFMALDPATASEDRFENAFRYYQPKAQRQRMISLFKGLCREAELMPGGSPETVRRTRSTSKSSVSTNGAKKVQPKQDYATYPEPQMVPTQHVSQTMSSHEFALIQGLVSKLPKEKKWTKLRREKWLQAMTATVDLLIDVVDSEDDVYSE